MSFELLFKRPRAADSAIAICGGGAIEDSWHCRSRPSIGLPKMLQQIDTSVECSGCFVSQIRK